MDGTNLLTHESSRRRLHEHALLPWRDRTPSKSGHARSTAKWRNFTFKGDGTYCKRIGGSFHKLYHGDNWQDFTHAQFCTAVNMFCEPFDLRPDSLIASTFEVAVNVIPPIPTPMALLHILMHRTKCSSRMPKVRTVADGLVITHEEFVFKIYDKAVDTGQPGHLLRFEVKIKKRRALERHGIRVQALDDLCNPIVWNQLHEMLLTLFDELLIVEPGFSVSGLTRKDQELLTKANDFSYWMGLSSGQRSRKRERLDQLYSEHVPNGLKASLRRSIAAKVEELRAEVGINSEVHSATFSPLITRCENVANHGSVTAAECSHPSVRKLQSESNPTRSRIRAATDA